MLWNSRRVATRYTYGGPQGKLHVPSFSVSFQDVIPVRHRGYVLTISFQSCLHDGLQLLNPKTCADTASVFACLPSVSCSALESNSKTMETKCHKHRLHMQRTKRLRKSQGRIQPDESESSEKDKASARLCTTITSTRNAQRFHSASIVGHRKKRYF